MQSYDGLDWPADPYEVPAWRLAQEERAAARGYSLPPYRCRADYEAMLAPIVAVLTEPVHLFPEVTKKVPKAKQLSPKEAAQKFFEDVTANGVVRYDNAQLDAAYRAHCAAHKLDAVHQNWLRAELAKLEGVTRIQPNIAAGRSSSGRRHRYRIWVLTPAKSERRRLAA